MNKKLNVQKCVTVVSEDVNLNDFVKCAIMLIDCSTKIIIVGENNISKVTEILDEIKDYRGGYDSIAICDTDCYIPKAMTHNKNVYLSITDFLNDFTDIRDLYFDSISDHIDLDAPDEEKDETDLFHL